MHMRL